MAYAECARLNSGAVSTGAPTETVADNLWPGNTAAYETAACGRVADHTPSAADSRAGRTGHHQVVDPNRTGHASARPATDTAGTTTRFWQAARPVGARAVATSVEPHKMADTNPSSNRSARAGTSGAPKTLANRRQRTARGATAGGVARQ